MPGFRVVMIKSNFFQENMNVQKFSFKNQTCPVLKLLKVVRLANGWDFEQCSLWCLKPVQFSNDN